MKILFWLEKRRVNARGEAPLMLRITHHGKRLNTSTGIRVKPQQWDAKKQRVRGSSQSINSILNIQRERCITSIGKLIKEGKPFSTTDIANTLRGQEKPEIGWLELFDQHLKHMQARVGVDYSSSTVRRYMSSKKNLKLFINDTLRKKDVHVSQIDRNMVACLDQFLRGDMKFSNNYVIKTMEHVRKVFKIGVIQGYTEHNPFDLISYKKSETHKEFLYADELKLLVDFNSENPKLQLTRDVFLFMCYTGLAHSDIQKASIHDIKRDNQDRPWLTLRRTKTDALVQVPLMSIAVNLISKYSNHSTRLRAHALLPVPCNQVLNRNLKELAKEVGIKKNISSHSGRYTFASTVLLGNGIRVEVAQKLLAHNSIKSTMVYSKLSSEALIGELESIDNGIL
ncbi:site-specific integrase [Flavobacteriales bacterium]|nr:site-specific integrase [Flavobacteriales bacterium]